MIEFHSSDLLSQRPPEISYLVDKLIPVGTLGDVSGPPGDGKSTILLSLASAVSVGEPWFGFRTTQTPVAWVSGEASGGDAIARDLHRLRVSKESDIMFILPDEPLFRFDRPAARWITTAEGGGVFQRMRDAGVGFAVIDTIGSLVAGLQELDNDQQRQLARHIKSETVGITTTTVSHTNQASTKESLDWRLHYLSRAGGNGFPGAIRWAGGVTRLQESDTGKIGGRLTSVEIAEAKIVAFGISKHNEMPQPPVNNFTPMLFEIKPSGELVLIADPNAVGLFQRASSASTTPRKKKAAPEFPPIPQPYFAPGNVKVGRFGLRPWPGSTTGEQE